MPLLDYILSWWKGRRPSPVRALTFILYTRAGCHLCEEALRTLNAERTKWGFRVETVDIDDEPTLKEKYGEWVPVVTVDGKVYFRGRVNGVLLQRLLRGRDRVD
jgi:glutaredoxin